MVLKVEPLPCFRFPCHIPDECLLDKAAAFDSVELLENQNVQFSTDFETGKRCVNFGDKNYSSIKELNSSDLDSSDLENLGTALQLAKIVNFLFNGSSYHVIEDPHSFCEKYESLREKSFHLGCVDHYDTKLVKKPKFHKGTLVFFAEKNCVLYEVTCQHIFQNKCPKITTKLLSSC